MSHLADVKLYSQLNIIHLFHRHRVIALGSVTSGFARAVFAITMIITTGVATRSFTKEEFGLWAILFSFIYLGYTFDFGFRSTLTNRLAAMVANSSGQTDIKNFFLSIFYLQVGIGIVGAFLFIISGNLIPWASLLKVQQPEMLRYINRLMIIVICILFVNVPFLVNSSVFCAFQEVHLDALLNAVQWVVLLGIFLVFIIIVPLKFGKVIICYFSAYLMIGIMRTIILFHHRKWCLSWVPIRKQFRNIKAISSVSSHFFLLNISTIIVSTGGTFLAGLIGGLTDAGTFNLIQRLFGFLINMHMALMASFVPAFTQWASLGDWDGVRRKFQFCLHVIVPLLFIGIGGMIFIFHPIILKLWTGLSMSKYTLAGLFALFALLMGWRNTNSILLNSLGLVKTQAMLAFIIAPIYLFLTFYFGKLIGVEGVVLANVLCAVPGTIIFTWYTKEAIKRRRLNV